MTHTGSDKSWITEYSSLSASTYSGLRSCTLFFVSVPVLGLCNWSGVFHLCISSCSLRVIRILFHVYWSLRSWRSVGMRDGVRRYNIGRCTDCLGGPLHHVSDIYPIHLWSFFSGKRQTFQSWDYQMLGLGILLGKSVPLQARRCPEGSGKLRFPDFMTTAQDGDKVVNLTHRPPLPPGNTPGTHFY